MRKVFEFDGDKVSGEVLVSVISEVRHMRRRKSNLKFVKVLNNMPFENTKIFREVNEIDGLNGKKHRVLLYFYWCCGCSFYIFVRIVLLSAS